MAAKRLLLISFFSFFFLFQCSAVRSFTRDSEPEDLLLEEIASYVRRQNHPKQQALPSFRQEDLSNAEKKFAYRPDEPQFRKTWPPMAPPPQTNHWSGAQDARSVLGGQKENIDFISNVPTTQRELIQDKHVPDAVGTQATGKPTEEVKVQSLDVNNNPAQLEPVTQDEDDGTDRISDGPIAHAIISHDGRAVREDNSLKDVYFTALVAGCTAAIVTITIGFGVCLYSWQKSRKMAQEVEYPAYGITGPGPLQGRGGSVKKSGSGGSMRASSPKKAGQGDKKLAHSAHMFHFQHQKQQVIAMENSVERNGSNSGAESDDEDNEEGDYTVYECPGLAPTGEMEVKNPLFPDDPTPLDTGADQRRSSTR